MKSFLFFINFVLFSLSANLFSQTDTLNFNDLNLTFENGKMKIFSEDQTHFEKQFKNPQANLADLDDDGLDELIINDSEINNDRAYFTFYLFTNIDSVQLADSVYSGLTEPDIAFSDELKSYVIISGSPDFDSLNNSRIKNIYTPMIVWNFTEQGLSIANDQIYEIFKTENTRILSYIDSQLRRKTKNCEAIQNLKAAIATVYVNYIYANENSTAENFLNKYYLCDDKDDFKKFLNEHQ